MALPKGKISKARKHSRRANWKPAVPGHRCSARQCQSDEAWLAVARRHCAFLHGRRAVPPPPPDEAGPAPSRRPAARRGRQAAPWVSAVLPGFLRSPAIPCARPRW